MDSYKCREIANSVSLTWRWTFRFEVVRVRSKKPCILSSFLCGTAEPNAYKYCHCFSNKMDTLLLYALCGLLAKTEGVSSTGFTCSTLWNPHCKNYVLVKLS